MTIKFQSSNCSVRKWIEWHSQFKASNPSFFVDSTYFNLVVYGFIFFLLFFFFFSTVFISLVRFLSFFLAPYHCAHAFFIIHWLLNRTFPLFRFVNSCTLFSYWSECPVLCQTPFLSELNATHLPLHTLVFFVPFAKRLPQLRSLCAPIKRKALNWIPF